MATLPFSLNRLRKSTPQDQCRCSRRGTWGSAWLPPLPLPLPLGAHGAWVGLLSCVCPLVLGDVALLSDVLGADGAWEQHLSDAAHTPLCVVGHARNWVPVTKKHSQKQYYKNTIYVCKRPLKWLPVTPDGVREIDDFYLVSSADFSRIFFLHNRARNIGQSSSVHRTSTYLGLGYSSMRRMSHLFPLPHLRPRSSYLSVLPIVTLCLLGS